MSAPFLDPSCSERDLDAWVTEQCRSRGWMRYHVVRPERGPAGFPDLVLSRGDTFAVVELKRSRGARGGEHDQHVNVKPEQAAWLDAGARARWLLSAVWRPGDAQAIGAWLEGDDDAPEIPGLWLPADVSQETKAPDHEAGRRGRRVNR